MASWAASIFVHASASARVGAGVSVIAPCGGSTDLPCMGWDVLILTWDVLIGVWLFYSRGSAVGHGSGQDIGLAMQLSLRLRQLCRRLGYLTSQVFFFRAVEGCCTSAGVILVL